LTLFGNLERVAVWLNICDAPVTLLPSITFSLTTTMANVKWSSTTRETAKGSDYLPPSIRDALTPEAQAALDLIVLKAQRSVNQVETLDEFSLLENEEAALDPQANEPEGVDETGASTVIF
jgi:hypothetical protein